MLNNRATTIRIINPTPLLYHVENPMQFKVKSSKPGLYYSSISFTHTHTHTHTFSLSLFLTHTPTNARLEIIFYALTHKVQSQLLNELFSLLWSLWCCVAHLFFKPYSSHFLVETLINERKSVKVTLLQVKKAFVYLRNFLHLYFGIKMTQRFLKSAF